MRFIIGFIFFGLLFYGIWLYFPEAFQTLVSWAAKVFDFFRELFEKISGSHPTTPPTTPLPNHEPKSILFFMLLGR